MTVELLIQFNGKQLTLPINPEELNIVREASNDELDIIGLGKTMRKAEPGLAKITIESFFPGLFSYFYTGVTPKTCIDFIYEIWNAENTNNNVGKIVSTGLPSDINMQFVIEGFEYDYKAGEEEDVYYKLELREYKSYGVKTVTTQLSGLAAARAVAPTQTAAQTVNTYVVQSGDCLWNITKACCGDGSRYMELYNLNKDIIGSNPNLIYPGQELTLPDGWATPTNVTKLVNVSKTKSNQAAVNKTEATTTVNGAAVLGVQPYYTDSFQNRAVQKTKLPTVSLAPSKKSSGIGGGGGFR